MVLESSLRLQSRLTLRGDLEQCLRLVPEWLQLDDEVREALPGIWNRLLFQPCFGTRIVKDLSRPEDDDLMAFGTTLALNERWRRRLHEDPPRLIAARIYRELLDGSFVPPTETELGVMNAAGTVTFLGLHYSQRTTDLRDPDALHMLSAGIAAFRWAHAGFRLDGLYQEGMGYELGFMASMGFRLYTRRAVEAGHTPGHPDHPELLGLSREDAANLLPGTPVRDMFQFTPPVLGLSGSERRLLRLAIDDLPDERIAAELELTTNTVKKLWRSIHERVATRLPDLYRPATGADVEPFSDTRGPEKRRLLLPYLRQHMEELRPWSP